jgi:TRAP-type C4-dicarboxylate transport system substrate-binding protein
LRKKLILGLMALVLAALPFCAACEGGEQEVYTLVVNDHNPSGMAPSDSVDHWAAYIEEQSGGRLDLHVIHGGALFTGTEEYDACKSGACDISFYVVDREQGFLLSTIITLPFMGFKEQHCEDIFYTLYDEFPEMQAEWDGVTIVTMMNMPFTHFHFAEANKVVKTPADIVGMKMMCAEATLAKVINAAGGTAVELDIAEMATSLQTGLADGVFNHFPVCLVFGALEMLHSHTVFGGAGINNTPMFLIMNTEVLEGLPQDLQDIILGAKSVFFNKFVELDGESMAAAQAFCEGNNHTMTYLTAAEIAVWRDKVKAAIHDAWIAEAEDAGLPGQEVYDRCLELAAE